MSLSKLNYSIKFKMTSDTKAKGNHSLLKNNMFRSFIISVIMTCILSMINQIFVFNYKNVIENVHEGFSRGCDDRFYCGFGPNCERNRKCKIDIYLKAKVYVAKAYYGDIGGILVYVLTTLCVISGSCIFIIPICALCSCIDKIKENNNTTYNFTQSTTYSIPSNNYRYYRHKCEHGIYRDKFCSTCAGIYHAQFH